MAQNKTAKMQNLLDYRMRITLNDGRQMTGQMIAFDKHMNLVLADTEEFRRVKRKAAKTQAPGTAPSGLVEVEEKRSLGLAIVRGAHVVSSSIDGPPPSDPASRLKSDAPSGQTAAPTVMAAGTGTSRPAGRGVPSGLSGPAAGVGGPGFPGQFPPGGGFPGAPAFGRGGPPPAFPPTSFPPGPPTGGPPGMSGPPGYQPGQGRGYPPPGYGGGR